MKPILKLRDEDEDGDWISKMVNSLNQV